MSSPSRVGLRPPGSGLAASHDFSAPGRPSRSATSSRAGPRRSAPGVRQRPTVDQPSPERRRQRPDATPRGRRRTGGPPRRPIVLPIHPAGAPRTSHRLCVQPRRTGSGTSWTQPEGHNAVVSPAVQADEIQRAQSASVVTDRASPSAEAILVPAAMRHMTFAPCERKAPLIREVLPK